MRWVDRRPVGADDSEAVYRVHAICDPEALSDVCDLLDAELTRATLPIGEVAFLSDTEDPVELAAVLVPIVAAAKELNAVVAALERSPLVRSATWSAQATA